MRSFAARLTVRFAVLVTSTLVFVLALGGWMLEHQMLHGLDTMHDVEGDELSEMIGNDLDLSASDIDARIRRDADIDSALFFIQVQNLAGEVMFRSDNLGSIVLPESPAGVTRWTTVIPGLSSVRIARFRHGPWRITVASALSPGQRVFDDYLRVSAILVVGVAILSIGLGYGFSRAVLSPVRAIESTARRIRADRLDERVPVPSGRDELASLATLLNQMFDRLQLSFTQVRRFTADASHELKTPLALVRLGAEKLRPRLATDAEGLAVLDDLLEEIDGLHQIIESLLFLSKAEGGAIELPRKEIDLRAFLAGFAEDAQALAEDRGGTFRIARDESGVVRGDPTLLRQLLFNLVSNALNASSAAAIELHSYQSEGYRRIEITDDGPGLPEDRLEAVFGRFVRYQATNPGRPGHGLGLAICRGIVELHGGRIRAENRGDGRSGLRVITELPV